MSSSDSVVDWIAAIRDGDEEAAQRVWDAYFPSLVRSARLHLGRLPRRVADEEDVALSALASFFRAAEKGRFPNLADRDGLWRLLSRITQRKAVTLIRRTLRKSGGGGNVRGDSVVAPGGGGGAEGLAELAVDELTPELAAIIAEDCRRLLDSLNDAQLRAIAVDKVEGYTNAEIAERQDLALRSVERYLHLIRKIWKREEASA